MAVPGSAVPQARPTAIVGAMSEELAPLIGRTRVDHRGSIDGCPIVWGTLGLAPVVVARTGEGRAAAMRGAETLLDNVPVERLLVLGVSGGLSESLDPGVLLVGRRALHEGASVAAPDGPWADAALELGGVAAADLVSSSRILCSPSSKSALLTELNLVGPAAVDLETSTYAEVAAAREIPWLAVRAICDTAEETLPLDFNQFRDPEGRIRRSRVVWHALSHPAAISGLRELQKRVALCATRLATFVHRLLNDSDEDHR